MEAIPIPLASARKADAACDVCGSFGALEIDERTLCADCVALAGCGCGGSAAASDDD